MVNNKSIYIFHLIRSNHEYQGGFNMCYFIGIEDLVANALIEQVDKTGKREVSFSKLSKYGARVVKILNEQNEEAMLLLSRDRTNSFIHNCTEYFSTRTDEEDEMYISLNKGIETDELRRQFRANIAFNVLLAFINENSLRALGV